MPITPQEVTDFMMDWFTGLKKCTKVEDITPFHLHSDRSDICMFTNTGNILTYQKEVDMRKCIENEVFNPSEFTITETFQSPERAWIQGTICWEASLIGTEDKLKTVFGVKCLIQRMADNSFKFILYIFEFNHPLPDCAPFPEVFSVAIK